MKQKILHGAFTYEDVNAQTKTIILEYNDGTNEKIVYESADFEKFESDLDLYRQTARSNVERLEDEHLAKKIETIINPETEEIIGYEVTFDNKEKIRYRYNEVKYNYFVNQMREERERISNKKRVAKGVLAVTLTGAIILGSGFLLGRCSRQSVGTPVQTTVSTNDNQQKPTPTPFVTPAPTATPTPTPTPIVVDPATVKEINEAKMVEEITGSVASAYQILSASDANYEKEGRKAPYNISKEDLLSTAMILNGVTKNYSDNQIAASIEVINGILEVNMLDTLDMFAGITDNQNTTLKAMPKLSSLISSQSPEKKAIIENMEVKLEAIQKAIVAKDNTKAKELINETMVEYVNKNILSNPTIADAEIEYVYTLVNRMITGYASVVQDAYTVNINGSDYQINASGKEIMKVRDLENKIKATEDATKKEEYRMQILEIKSQYVTGAMDETMKRDITKVFTIYLSNPTQTQDPCVTPTPSIKK